LNAACLPDAPADPIQPGCSSDEDKVDDLRSNPEGTLARFPASHTQGAAALPASIRLLRWAFVTGPRRDLFRRAIVRAFESGIDRRAVPPCRFAWRVAHRRETSSGWSCVALRSSRLRAYRCGTLSPA
jgi:hypothetical protein